MPKRRDRRCETLPGDMAPKPRDIGPNEALRLCRSTTVIWEIIDLTYHPDPRVRQRALVEMCPCRVKNDLSPFWSRVLAMVDDPERSVRKQVLHTLCDGSPKHMEFLVTEALDGFNHDADPEVRRMAHKALAAYHKSGKWNVL